MATTKRGYMKYTREDLQEAIDAVKKRGFSINGAAREFKIPRGTLQDHLKGKSSIDKLPGRQPAIPKAIETKMVDQILEASDKGFSQTKQQILAKTGRLVKSLKLKTPFKNDVPSREFWRTLKKRHPTITTRKPESCESSRMSMLNEKVVNDYFEDLQRVVASLNVGPMAIWNMDETGIQFSHTPSSVVARKGKKSVLARTSDSKDHITIVACINAGGKALPPLLITRGKSQRCIESFAVQDGPKDARWTYSERAWTNDVLGELWFRDVFLPHCGDERPQLLIMDSHSSHETSNLLQDARDNGITIIALPPHTTSQLQPLDKVVFKPLKSHYNRICTEHMSENPSNKINKVSWPRLFRTAWEETMREDLIRKAFEATGIFPVNRHALSADALKPSEAMDRPPVEPTEIMCSVAIPMGQSVEIELPSEFQASTSEAEIILLPQSQPETVEFPNDPSGVTVIEDDDSDQSPSPSTSQTPQHDNPTDLLLQACIESGIHSPPDWEQEVETIFSPPKAVAKPPSTRQAITKHRILTNDDIIAAKLEKQRKKLEVEQKRAMRVTKKKNATIVEGMDLS